MTTSELKKSIVENILQVEDEALLNDISVVLKMKNESPNRITIPNWHKERIEESIKQMERGEYISNEEVFKEIESWLKK